MIRLADDLDQRRSAAVQIDVGKAVGILEAVVNALSGVIFHVHAGHADPAGFAVTVHLDEAVFGERLIVLRDLVALGKVRVKIIFAGEDGFRVHLALECKRGFDRELNRVLVEHRQCPRHPQTDGTNIAVGRRAKTSRASAEDFRAGRELNVHFEPDDGLIFGDDGGRRQRIFDRRHVSLL